MKKSQEDKRLCTSKPALLVRVTIKGGMYRLYLLKRTNNSFCLCVLFLNQSLKIKQELKSKKTLPLISNPLRVPVSNWKPLPNHSWPNCGFVLAQTAASFSELRHLKRSSGWIEGPKEKKKTDGRQTFTQRGSCGFYWQQQNLV